MCESLFEKLSVDHLLKSIAKASLSRKLLVCACKLELRACSLLYYVASCDTEKYSTYIPLFRMIRGNDTLFHSSVKSEREPFYCGRH